MVFPVADPASVGSGLSELSEEVTVLVVVEEEVEIELTEMDAVEEDNEARTRLIGFP